MVTVFCFNKYENFELNKNRCTSSLICSIAGGLNVSDLEGYPFGKRWKNKTKRLTCFSSPVESQRNPAFANNTLNIVEGNPVLLCRN